MTITEQDGTTKTITPALGEPAPLHIIRRMINGVPWEFAGKSQAESMRTEAINMVAYYVARQLAIDHFHAFTGDNPYIKESLAWHAYQQAHSELLAIDSETF